MLMRLDRFLDEMLAKCEINSEILSVEWVYCYQQKTEGPLVWSMTIQSVVGIYDLYPVNYYINN